MKKTMIAIVMMLCSMVVFSICAAAEGDAVCPECGGTDWRWYSVINTDGKDAHARICNACDIPISNYEVCTPDEGTATCTTPARCKVCGIPMFATMSPDPTKHDFEETEYWWNFLGYDENSISIYKCTARQTCSRCVYNDEVWVISDYEITTSPTCTEPGILTYIATFEEEWAGTVYNDTLADVPALGHKNEVDEAVEPTCTEPGLTKGFHCGVCGEILKAQEEIPALGHSPVTDEGHEPTCTEPGLTEGSHCDVCEAILEEQEEIPALGHSPVADEGYEATCTEPGLTEGSHCGVCGEILKAQEEIPALGHSPVTDEGYEATCTEPGLTEGSHCGVCGEILKAQEEIPALGHSPVTDEGYEATCTDPGLTEGSHCDVCGEILKEQEEIPALGHKYKSRTTEPTCTEDGCVIRVCTVCGDSYVSETIPAMLHHFDLWTPNGDHTHSAPCRRCSYIGMAECMHLEVTAADGETVITVCPVCGEIGDEVFEVIEDAEMTPVADGILPTGEAIIRGMEAPFDDVLYAFTAAYEYAGEAVPFGTAVSVSVPLSAEQFASFELFRVDVTAATENEERTEVRTAVPFMFENDVLTFEADDAALYLIVAR